ncbi:MAG TPA: nuclear transport factor 2 family protein [Longimicrobiaceae bacterium]|nr:nuclear transport factor 2 family protein [Longimicrobiaceae bacterium]
MRKLAAVSAVLVLSACAPVPAEAPEAASVPADLIEAELVASTEAWNRGDLEGFLEPYLDSPDITYVGRSGLVRGKEALRETYVTNFWSEGAPTDDLSFADIEVRPLGPDHALLTGRYLLFDEAGVLQDEGPFSLIYANTPAGWKIIHDHSS